MELGYFGERETMLPLVMDVLYYYYYLFYTRVLPDGQPHSTVIFTLSFSESLLVNYGLDILGVHFLCKFLLTKWSMIGIFLLIAILNWLIYYRSGRNRRVVDQEPKLFNSNRLSILFTAAFFLFTTSLLFWAADYMMIVIEQCQ
jgi:hypothetical protein